MFRDILGLVIWPPELDRKEHVDLVSKDGRITVGVRLQKAKYRTDYGPHWTIRDRWQGGDETEFRRLMEGGGPQLMLSGFRHQDLPEDTSVVDWWYLVRSGALIAAEPKHRRNNDDGSSLIRIQRTDIPAGWNVKTGRGLCLLS